MLFWCFYLIQLMILAGGCVVSPRTWIRITWSGGRKFFIHTFPPPCFVELTKSPPPHTHTHTLPGFQYCWAVACFCPPTFQLLMRSPYWPVLNCEICNKQLQTYWKSQQLLNLKISLTKCLWKIILVGKSMKHTCASFRRPKRKIPSSWRYVRNSNSRKFGFNSQRMQARFSSARLQQSRTQ